MMKLKQMLVPVFALSLVGACEERQGAAPQESQAMAGVAPGEAEENAQPVRPAEKITPLTGEELYMDAIRNNVPQYFDVDTERECAFATNMQQSFNKNSGVADPDLNNAGSYFQMRTQIADGLHEAAQKSITLYYNKYFPENLPLEESLYRLDLAARQCTQLYLSKEPS